MVGLIPQHPFDVPLFLYRLDRYATALAQDAAWYRFNNAMAAIKEFASNNYFDDWNDGLKGDMGRLFHGHSAMEPRLRPEQPTEDSLDAIQEALPASLVGVDTEQIEDELDAITESADLSEAVDEEVTTFLKETARDIRETNDEDDTLPEQKERKNRRLFRLLVRAAASVAALAGTMASGLAVNAFSSAEAATRLHAALERLLSLLQQIF